MGKETKKPTAKKDHIKKPKATVSVKVKTRKKLPPPTQKQKLKKGKGAYDRKADKKVDKKAKLTNEQVEKAQIIGFIEALIAKDYSQSHKYLTDIVNGKIGARIAAHMNTPLF